MFATFFAHTLPSSRSKLVCVCSFLETVEYFYDHHTKGYPHTTDDPTYRIHAIACLWLVNILWLLAPLVSLVWGYQKIAALIEETKGEAKDVRVKVNASEKKRH